MMYQKTSLRVDGGVLVFRICTSALCTPSGLIEGGTNGGGSDVLKLHVGKVLRKQGIVVNHF